MRLARLREMGFDRSYHVPFTKSFHVSCSQCEALCINGIPAHETGCINQRYSCKGCDTLLDYNGYCQDCR